MISYEEAKELARDDYLGSYDPLDAWVKAGLVKLKKKTSLEEARRFKLDYKYFESGERLYFESQVNIKIALYENAIEHFKELLSSFGVNYE